MRYYKQSRRWALARPIAVILVDDGFLIDADRVSELVAAMQSRGPERVSRT